MKTSIEWTDHSINPIRARRKGTDAVGHYCEMTSPGCAHCYSSAFQPRFGLPAFKSKNTRDQFGIFLDESRLREVLRRKKPTKYFWCDMTDLFGEWVPDAMIDKCFAVMAATPHHTHQVLTKRAERLPQYLAAVGENDRSDAALLRGKSLAKWARELFTEAQGWELLQASAAGWWERARMPNVWFGVSVENQQQANERIPHLLRAPATVRFLSCEPLLGPVDLETALGGWSYECQRCGANGACPEEPGDPCGAEPPEGFEGEPECPGHLIKTRLPGVNWVIAGGESGPGARPCNVAWIRSLRDQCKAAHVPCFVKQLGAEPILQETRTAAEVMFPNGVPAGVIVEGSYEHFETFDLVDRKGANWDEWPEDLRVRQMPEVAHA